MPIYASAELQTPQGILSPGGGGGGGGVSNASVPLNTYYKREWDVHPAAALTGPLASDTGLLTGDVASGNQAGLRFIPWNAVDSVTAQPIFNFQGMVPAPAPAGIQSAAGRSCLLNAATPRYANGAAGQYFNGNQDIRVGIASTKVIPVWYVGQGQITASTVDMHMLMQYGSKNQHLSSSGTSGDGLPATITGGSGTYRREITNNRHEYKEYRFMMGANCYFLGCWIDTLSVIRRPQNKPLVFVHGVDSWQDSQTWLTDGYSWTGEYQCLGQYTMASFRTGMCHGTDGQGGTGEYNPNGTVGGDLSTYNGNRSSAAWSDSRVGWRVNWWSSQFPIWADIGGWNDGSRLQSPYQSTYRTRVAARMQKTIDRCTALGRATRFLNVGIQPADISGPTDPKWLAALGQAEIPGLFPGVCIGHVPLMPMWPDSTTTGPRSIYCGASDGLHIHLRLIGANVVCGYIWDAAGEFLIDTAFVDSTVNANVPVVTVPTT